MMMTTMMMMMMMTLALMLAGPCLSLARQGADVRYLNSGVYMGHAVVVERLLRLALRFASVRGATDQTSVREAGGRASKARRLPFTNSLISP